MSLEDKGEAKSDYRSSNMFNDSERSGGKLLNKVVLQLGIELVKNGTAHQSLGTEAMLANKYNVSRSVMRESVKLITAKGMIEAKPGVGLRVRPKENWNLLDPALLSWRYSTMERQQFNMELFTVRKIFEPAAAEIAAETATADDLREIEEAYLEMKAADDREMAVAADLRYHMAIVKSCRNDFLTHIARLTGVAIRVSFDDWRASYEASTPMHGVVLEAIRARSGTLAYQAMTELLAIAGSTQALNRKT